MSREAMNGGSGRVCFVFLDGVGLAPDSPHNPLASAPMPTVRRLLGRALVEGPPVAGGRLLLRALDACLGVEGPPQSATGQTALFTGVNAAAHVGAHVPAYPTEPLRRIIAEHSVLKRASEHGLSATFANAYTPSYWQRAAERKLRHSASTLTAMAGGLPFRSLDDLLRGEAVYWDITHDVMAAFFGLEFPQVPPELAGTRLARLTAQHDLVLFESFLTDLAGHGRLPWTAEEVLGRVDRFLRGLLEALPPAATLVLSSDHGNIEDSSTRSHTRNRVPLLVVGPGSTQFESASSITDVAPGILRCLGVRTYDH